MMRSMQVPQKSAPNLSCPEEVETPLILVIQESDETQKSKSTTMRLRLGGPYRKIYVRREKNSGEREKNRCWNFPTRTGGGRIEKHGFLDASMPFCHSHAHLDFNIDNVYSSKN
jgi:hypothetical protein